MVIWFSQELGVEGALLLVLEYPLFWGDSRYLCDGRAVLPCVAVGSCRVLDFIGHQWGGEGWAEPEWLETFYRSAGWGVSSIQFFQFVLGFVPDGHALWVVGRIHFDRFAYDVLVDPGGA